jgi:hypothetical protein
MVILIDIIKTKINVVVQFIKMKKIILFYLKIDEIIMYILFNYNI